MKLKPVQPKQYGKGSGRRRENVRAINQNWTAIKGFSKPKYKLGKESF